jgi:[ribosomal protein S5]-alanine N-acetyltransferase
MEQFGGIDVSTIGYIYTRNEIGVKGLGEEELAGNYPNWFTDADVCQFNRHGVFPKSKENIAKFVRSLDGDMNRLVWAVYRCSDQLHVGNISLQNISYIDRSAEIAFIFGEKSCWGKGFAFDAATLLLDHAWHKLNLRRIACGTASTNIAMQRLALKLNMIQEGIRRQALYLNGQYVDILEFGLLKSDSCVV